MIEYLITLVIILIIWLFVGFYVTIVCSEKVKSYMIIIDIAFIFLIIASFFFSSGFQRHLKQYSKTTEQQRLNQEANEYLKDLPITKLYSLKSGDVLEYGCSLCPYVVSNEAHLFSATDTVITETVVKWLISGNTEVKDREYVSVFRNFTSNSYGEF